MTPIDRKMMFQALGFLAVVLRGEMEGTDQAKRARGLAWLIEEFCRHEVPEAFGFDNDGNLNGLVGELKATPAEARASKLPADKAGLVRLYLYLEAQTENALVPHFPKELLIQLILQMIEHERG